MIKIINGVFGYRSGNSIIPKTSKDEPFECDKATEKRLVGLGVAKYVTAEVAEEVETEETGECSPLYTKETSLAELKEIAKKLGATEEDLKSIRSKVAAKELIDNLPAGGEGETEEAGEVDDDAPSFDDADGVVA